MTFNEFGLQLRQRWPDLNDVPLSNHDLAQWVLNEWPELYDIISPTARKVKERAEEPIITPEGVFESWQTVIENRGRQIQNRRAEIAMLHEADLVIQASAEGVPVTALSEIAVETHKTNELIRLERFRRDNGLDGADRIKLTPHYLIRQLEAELDQKIDERDKETHPDKREVKTIRIQQLKEELRARGEQAVVQAGGRSRLGQPDEDVDGSGNSESSAEADTNRVSTARPGIGFRRDGDAS